jgi:hypothetical protein
VKAFPLTKDMVLGSVSHFDAQGMDLRDYFAAKAMQSLMANFLDKELDLEDPFGWMDGLASDAYSMAKAMMEARNAAQ